MSKTGFLEPLEDLAYRRMLDLCYLTEKPLPESIDEIAMLIRMRSHCDSIAVVLRYFFELTADGYINDMAVRVIAEYQGKSSKAKASAGARWEKERAKKLNESKGLCDGDANALRTECEGNANHKPITNNHEPITMNQYKYVFDLDYVNANLLKSGVYMVDQKFVDELQPQFELYYADQPMTDNKALAKFVQWILRNTKSNSNQNSYQTAAQKTEAEHDKWKKAEQQAFGEKDVTPKKKILIEDVGHA